MKIKVYKSLPPRPVIKEGVTTWEDYNPPLEYDEIEVCDECKKQECECKQ